MKFWGKLAVAATVAWASSTAFALTDPTSRQGEPLSALASVDASAGSGSEGQPQGRVLCALADTRASKCSFSVMGS